MTAARSIQNSTLSVLRHPLDQENVIALYITLKPLYFWKSGLPQISDVLLILYVLYTVLIKRGKLKIPTFCIMIVCTLTGLVAYQALINLVWSVVVNEALYPTVLFYAFNEIALLFCLSLSSDIGVERLKQSVINGCVLSCAVSLIGLGIGSYSLRGTSFFNNPNQLGYHGILVLSLLISCMDASRPFKTLFITVSAIWLIVVSASKAALLGACGLLVLYLLLGQTNRKIKSKLMQVLLLLLVFGIIYLVFFSNNAHILANERIAFARSRIINMMAENDSALGAGRGYDRIQEIGTHIIWGVGEGAYDRFTSLSGKELHSTYGSIIVSYGIIGAMGYLLVLGRIVFARSPSVTMRNLIWMSGLLLYGVTHNGIRNTLLWVFFAVLLVAQQPANDESESY